MEKDAVKCVVIGGSAGSLQIILHILSGLNQNFQIPLIIVMHRKNEPKSNLVEVLASRAKTPVKEAEDKERIEPGLIYLAPADYHLLVENDHSLSLDVSEKIHYSRPGIDATFQTAADAYGRGLITILLSGANADGTDGLKQVRLKGGTTIVQQPDDAQVPYMPQSAIDQSLADHILSKEGIVKMLNSVAGKKGL
ncbi:MAG: chemotaxis protein CheB [Mucilaginibacter polytrichastri]|nr:chemotaxis protein CheB [Mucilaginibacter polytrichastri]